MHIISTLSGNDMVPGAKPGCFAEHNMRWAYASLIWLRRAVLSFHAIIHGDIEFIWCTICTIEDQSHFCFQGHVIECKFFADVTWRVNESNRKNSFPRGLYPKQRLSVRQSGLKVRSSTSAGLIKQTKMPFFLRDWWTLGNLRSQIHVNWYTEKSWCPLRLCTSSRGMDEIHYRD